MLKRYEVMGASVVGACVGAYAASEGTPTYVVVGVAIVASLLFAMFFMSSEKEPETAAFTSGPLAMLFLDEPMIVADLFNKYYKGRSPVNVSDLDEMREGFEPIHYLDYGHGHYYLVMRQKRGWRTISALENDDSVEGIVWDHAIDRMNRDSVIPAGTKLVVRV